jgi:hypothetical protein
MNDEPPVDRLVHALLLSALRKQVRYIALVPHAVWFGTDAGWQQEMRPPSKLEAPIAERFAQMIGAEVPAELGEWVAGPLVLEIDANRESFAVRIERIRQGTWIVVEHLNDLEVVRRVRAGGVWPVEVPSPIPGQSGDDDDLVFDPVL